VSLTFRWAREALSVDARGTDLAIPRGRIGLILRDVLLIFSINTDGGTAVALFRPDSERMLWAFPLSITGFAISAHFAREHQRRHLGYVAVVFWRLGVVRLAIWGPPGFHWSRVLAMSVVVIGVSAGVGGWLAKQDLW